MTAQDPQRITGQPYVLPRDCVCGHSAYVHVIPEGKHVRTSCSSWHGGKCKCERFTPIGASDD